MLDAAVDGPGRRTRRARSSHARSRISPPTACAFVAPRPDAWFARTATSRRIDTTPLDAVVRRPIFDHLPRGADGETWQRWQNEIQMLLHAHPVNAAREARGARPVTGLWFWGGGRASEIAAAPGPARRSLAAPRTRSATSRAAYAPARRSNGRRRPDFVSVDDGADAAGKESTVVVLPPVAGDAALPGLAAEWLAPAVAALARGDVTALDVVADGNGVTTRWHAPRPSRLVRLTARWRGARFVVPSFDIE